MDFWRLAAALALLLAAGAFPARADAAYEAKVRVTGVVLNVVRPEMFGDNLEWVDGPKLWRAEQRSFDPEMMQAIRDVGVSQIRYPGGTLSDYFHWRDAVGADRKPIPNPFDAGAPEYPAFGPEELGQLTRELGVPAYITLNAGTGTPEEAAAWVAYCRDHGQKVSGFEVGNEIYLADPAHEQVPSLPIAKTPQQYVDFFLACRQKIDAVAPGAKVGAIGLLNTGPAPFTHDANWLRDVIAGVGGKMDFLSIHDAYAPGTRVSDFATGGRLSDTEFAKAFLGSTLFVRDNLEKTKQALAIGVPGVGSRIPIHITECGALVLPFGPDVVAQLPDFRWNRSLTGALYLAELYHVLLAEPRVTHVDHLPLIQDISGALIGVRDPGPRRVLWRNAEYYVFRQYAHLVGRGVLNVNVACPVYAARRNGLIPEQPAVPCLDAAAFRSPDKHALTITLLNRDVSRVCRAVVRPGSAAFRVVRRTLLNGPALDSVNEPGQPETVHPVTRVVNAQILGGQLAVNVPPHSLMTLEIRL